MKIGFLVLSLTQSIPYITYLVSLGYDVFPIILKQDKNIKNNRFSTILEVITDKKIYDEKTTEIEKLDSIIIIANSEQIGSIKNIDYNSILKEEAPIIVNTYKVKDIEEVKQTFAQDNMSIINYEQTNIVDNCNTIISHMEKVLKKNS